MTIKERNSGRLDQTVAYHPIRIFKTANKNIDEVGYELWVTYNETADSYFIVSMLMPVKEFNYMLWAENVAAYNLVLNSFLISDKK